MNLNVYIENSLAKSLDQYAKQHNQSRNAVIREAIRTWIAAHEAKEWPDLVLKFKGVPDMPSFESYREDLMPPDEDPFK